MVQPPGFAPESQRSERCVLSRLDEGRMAGDGFEPSASAFSIQLSAFRVGLAPPARPAMTHAIADG